MHFLPAAAVAAFVAIIAGSPALAKDTGLIFLTRSIEVPGRELTPGFTKTYLEANHLDGLALDVEDAGLEEHMNLSAH